MHYVLSQWNQENAGPTYKGRSKHRINMDYFNYVGCFFFPSVYDKNNSM